MAANETTDALAKVGKLYSENVQRLGVQPTAVGWRDADTHNMRFRKLAAVIDAASPTDPLTVNDYGCGYGAMFNFLAGYSPDLVRYDGYDISPEMLAAAKDQVTDERSHWHQSSTIETDADFSFVSGTFNVRFEASDAKWQEFITNTLQMLAAKSQRGIAFNLLSTYVDWREDHLYYGDPGWFFDYCKRNLSGRVTLLHDYPLYEWTIYVVFDD